MSQQLSCPNCGSPVAFGVMFCGNCGTQLNWPTQQQIRQPMDIGIPLAGRNIRLVNDKAFMTSTWEIRN